MTASRFVIRLFLVPIGLALAILAGIAVATFALQRSGTFSLPGEPAEFSFEIFWIAAPVLAFAGPILFGAGLAAAMLAEVFSIRSWVFYALAGGAIAFFSARFFGFMDQPGLLTTEVAIGSGLAAGLVYWLVAGRSAGAG